MAAIRLFFCLHVNYIALFASFSIQNSFVFYTCWRGEEDWLTYKQKNDLLAAILE